MLARFALSISVALVHMGCFAIAPTYVAVPLVSLSGGNSTAVQAINNLGASAGSSNGLDTTLGGGTYAVFWNAPTQISSLGLLDSIRAGNDQSFAYGINNLGQIVGWSGSSFGPRAFMWDGTMHNLGALANYPGTSSSYSYAYAVNNAGHIVGSSLSESGWTHAFLYKNSAMLDLGTVTGNSHTTAYAINNKDQVVGEDVFSGAFLWEGGVMQTLGTLPGGGGGASTAYSINDNGTIVGVSGSLNGERAFRYSNGVMTELGTLPGDFYSAAYSINASGSAVGRSVYATGFERAVLFQGGSVYNLNDLILNSADWELSEAHAINDSGQIVGTGIYKGQGTSFILEPLAAPPAVPELPVSSLMLFGIGILSMRRMLAGFPEPN